MRPLLASLEGAATSARGGLPAAGGLRRADRFRRGGFTFMELMLVVAILGVLYAISAVSFRGLAPRYYLKSSSRKLGSTIEQVRLSAINRGLWMGIRYVLTPIVDEPPYYEIIPPPPPDYPDQPLDQRKRLAKEPLAPGIRFARILLANNRAVEHGSINVLFSPMGNAGSHIVVLQGESGRAMSVRMNSITGTLDFVERDDVTFQNFRE